MGTRGRGSARGEVLSSPTAALVGSGSLVVVSTPIGNLEDLSPRAAGVLASADLICCEDTRHTGRLLAHLRIEAPRLISLHAHNEASRVTEVLRALEEGRHVALCSDAGTPLVSDPGARLLRAAIAAGATVSAVPGPSALLGALVVSGFSGRFVFEGFLPRKGPERRARLEAISSADAISILYEAPGRVAATLSELIERCGGSRKVAICRELTKLHEELFHGSLEEAAGARLVIEPRGEYVVVLAPSEARPQPAAALRDALQSLRRAGMSSRDAVRAVEVLLKVGHREAYELALALDREAKAGDEAPRQGEGR